jgi:hypothetical protein
MVFARLWSRIGLDFRLAPKRGILRYSRDGVRFSVISGGRKGYRDFEDRVGVTNARRAAKRDMIRDAVKRLPKQIPICGSLARAAGRQQADDCARYGSCAPKARSDVGRRARDATWEKIGRAV